MKIQIRYVILAFAIAVAGAGLWQPASPSPATENNPPGQATLVQTVRDSDAISRYIDMNYPQPQVFNLALNQYAQAQLRFLNQSADSQEAWQHHVAVGRSTDCVFYVARVYAKEETNWAINAIDRVFAVITATPEARNKMARSQKLLGNRYYTGVPVAQEAQTCEFPVSTPEMERLPQESDEDADA